MYDSKSLVRIFDTIQGLLRFLWLVELSKYANFTPAGVNAYATVRNPRVNWKVTSLILVTSLIEGLLSLRSFPYKNCTLKSSSPTKTSHTASTVAVSAVAFTDESEIAPVTPQFGPQSPPNCYVSWTFDCVFGPPTRMPTSTATIQTFSHFCVLIFFAIVWLIKFSKLINSYELYIMYIV